MNKISKLKKYDVLFRKNIKSYLSQNVTVKTIIHPVMSEGAVFEFILNMDGEDDIVVNKCESDINYVLKNIHQTMIIGTLDHIQFSGTNLYLEQNRIVVIKGQDDNRLWTGEAVSDDIRRVVSSSQGGRG
ncbi:hypothetical protein [Photobacterium sanguinicancri]|uniref:hypothetical protein n=1 Tax=Photobacterium sanguinicancri TaxID=875932 RepID=UPI000787A681|nr:hypothetical protein [Photobacterium sanguinicancri]KXI23677.1 hypothetical protein AS132_06160 [Photobacterium sanguinicancri]